MQCNTKRQWGPFSFGGCPTGSENKQTVAMKERLEVSRQTERVNDWLTGLGRDQDIGGKAGETGGPGS